MNYEKLQVELLDSKPILLSKWEVQSDKKDYDTNFIYYCHTLLQVIELSDCNAVDVKYAVHRWYNFWCSKFAEHCLCENGAVAEDNQKHHDIDLYIKDIHYDVKVTVLPKEFPTDTDLTTRDSKNRLIRWFIEKQSKEGRLHNENKLYFVCVGTDYTDSMLLKCNFEKISECANKFMNYYKDHELNKVKCGDKEIYADLIIVK